MTLLSRLVPDVTLSEQAFAARHRVLRLLLWLHVPVILVLGFFTGELGPGHHATLLLSVLGAVLLCGIVSGTAVTQRGRETPSGWPPPSWASRSRWPGRTAAWSPAQRTKWPAPRRP